MYTRKSRFEDKEDIKMYRLLSTNSSKPLIEIPRNCTPVSDDDRRVVGPAINFTSSFKPRNDDQVRIVRDATKLLQARESFVIQAATGKGKTACSMQLIANVGRKTLIMVHKEDLKGQWRKACRDFLGLKDSEIGEIYGDKCDVVGKKVVIGYMQSLCKRGRYPSWVYKDFGFIICDEVHRMGAEKFSEAMWLFPALLRMGLSATPKRKDGRDVVFRAHIGPVRIVADGLPMVPKVIRVTSTWKIPQVVIKDKVTGESSIGPLPHTAGKTMHLNKMLSRHKSRTNLIAQFARQCHKAGRNVVVFSETKEMLELLEGKLRGLGVPKDDMGYFIGGIKAEAERDRIKALPLVLATFKMCEEGTDAPWWNTAILCHPRSDVRQTVGRILREYEGKIDASEWGKVKGVVPIVFDVLDKTSNVFQGYENKRLAWYHEIGAIVVDK
jgi:superfamily II DNA or RNA helicase